MTQHLGGSNAVGCQPDKHGPDCIGICLDFPGCGCKLKCGDHGLPAPQEIIAAMKALHADRCAREGAFMPFAEIPELTRQALERDAVVALRHADAPAYPL